MKRVVAVLLLASLSVAGCGDDKSEAAVEVPAWANVAPEQIAEAKKRGVPVAFENELGMRFVLIPQGRFVRGLNDGDDSSRIRGAEISTSHRVAITRPFYMQVTETTNAQFQAHDPTHVTKHVAPTSTGMRHPVGSVVWSNAVAFAEWLSARQGARAYRLPTDAEWEYSCRAGTTGRWWWGDDVRDGSRFANLHAADSREQRAAKDPFGASTPVASFRPNPWGLYDMIGNVLEWVSDWYGPYPSGTVRDPAGPEKGDKLGTRISRGAHWNAPAFLTGTGVRWEERVGSSGWIATGHIGFRLVSPLPERGE